MTKTRTSDFFRFFPDINRIFNLKCKTPQGIIIFRCVFLLIRPGPGYPMLPFYSSSAKLFNTRLWAAYSISFFPMVAEYTTLMFPFTHWFLQMEFLPKQVYCFWSLTKYPLSVMFGSFSVRKWLYSTVSKNLLSIWTKTSIDLICKEDRLADPVTVCWQGIWNDIV